MRASTATDSRAERAADGVPLYKIRGKAFMLDLLFTLASFIVALGVLISVHEFGHFWVARRLGVRVLRFSIGFGAPILKWVSPRDGTEYVLASIPLGGYVKMLDEREGTVPALERARAFNRQRLWKRSAIVAAGPAFNVLFAILAYWGIFVVGDTGAVPLIAEVREDSVAAEAGFRPGDELISVGGRTTPTWERVVFTMMVKAVDGKDVVVRVREADGWEAERLIPGERLTGLGDDPAVMSRIGLVREGPVLPPLIGEVAPGDPADRAGLRSGDLVLTAAGEAVESWEQFVERVRASPQTPMIVEVERDSDEMRLELVPRAINGADGPVGRIGAGVQLPDDFGEEYRSVMRLDPLSAVGAAAQHTYEMTTMMLRVIGRMLIGESSVQNLSGPITIADTAGKMASHGFEQFIEFLAIVSISLGVINLLPIPILDGGHLLFFAAEAVKGSPLPDEILMHGQRIGLAILLALMGLAFYVDITRLLG